MSKRKLLLADDSITIQKVVNLTFADEGIEVISVSDGDSAMQRLIEVSPDLVMADVHMPGISGYQICEKIRESRDFNSIPVILLVGSFEPFDEDEAKRVGADGYLTKPFQSIRQLVNKVTSLLESGRIADSHSTQTVSNESAPVEEISPFTAVPQETFSTPLDTAKLDNPIAFETKPVEDIKTSVENFADDSVKSFDDNEILETHNFSNTDEILETEVLPEIQETQPVTSSFSDYSQNNTAFDDSNFDDEMIETSQAIESTTKLEETDNLDLIEEVKSFEQTIPITETNSSVDNFATTQEMSLEEIQDVISKEDQTEFKTDSVIETSTPETLSESGEETLFEKSAETYEKQEDKDFVLDSTPVVQLETSPFTNTVDDIAENSNFSESSDESVEITNEIHETGFDFVKTEEVIPVASDLEIDDQDKILETPTADENIESIDLPESLTILDFDDQNLLEIAPREEDFRLAENEDEELLVDDVADINQLKAEDQKENVLEPITQTIENEEVKEIEASQSFAEPIIEEIEEETNTAVLEEPILESSNSTLEELYATPIIKTETETVEIVEEIEEEKVERIEEKTEEAIVETIEETVEEKAVEISETPVTAFVSTPIISETKEKEVVETPIETAKVYDEKVSVSSLSPELIDVIANRVVEKLSERVIREIAWEVVPQHVDLIVKKMVEEKLKEN